MTVCTVLKPFPLSRDGITSIKLTPGMSVDIPNALVPGLVAERFVGEAGEIKAAAPVENKAIPRAEEVQAFSATPENKAAPPAEEVAGMSKPSVIAALESLGADVDKRKGVETLRVVLLNAITGLD